MPHTRRAASGPLYLCIDQGGHASRALVYDARGKPVAAAHREARLQIHADGRLEYDARELLDSVTAAVDAVLAELGSERRRLVAAGLATQRSMAGFLLSQLARERPLYADPANAARTQLWDLAAGDWSAALLELFELPRTPLPQPVPNRHAFGTLANGDAPLPLLIVTGDQNAALYAGGRPAPDVFYVTVGTGAFVQRLTDGERPDSHRLLHSLVYAGRAATVYGLEGTVNGAGSALDWLAARHPHDDIVAGLHGWLTEIADPPLFLNGVSGLGTPFMQPHFASRFVGAAGPAQQAVAVVESIVFLLQLNLEEIGRLRPPATHIEIGGGLSRYDGLCRRLADLSGLPVRRSGRVETTGRGLAFLLHAAATDHSDETPWDDAMPDTHIFLPQADAALNARYLRWRTALREALKT